MINKYILQKYFSGLCDAEEHSRVVNFLANEQSDLAALHELLEEEAAHAQEEVLPVTLEKELHKGVYRYIFINGVLVRRLWQTVAAAAVLLPVLFAWHLFSKKADFKNLAKVKANTHLDEGWKVLLNKGNENQKATMPDGTQIWLMAHSSIQYQPHLYGKHLREIKLEGEAFFDVATDAQHPFIVRHGVISTQVLGTSFNIEAYDNEGAIRIALVSGKVMVKRTGDSLEAAGLKTLSAGQLLSYRKKDNSYRVKPLVIKDEAVWKQGNIVFNDIPLKDALTRLRKKYDITIEAPDHIDMSNMRVTAVFKSGNAEQVLQNLLFIHNLHFRKHKNVFTIF
ncbi:FecR family protein [Filimonas lacunae]|uniref:FecR family protein n=1 Tax=Filimonas lacunae TaxID=477680 RepID=A0A173MDS9_9BACT|nr:FecR domain-containing protein [Filimonas lacunae]BAV05656.1 anti-sigma factor [Filimonas lacunae]SIT29021.1 FecR family protein [Filimonas lacunae]